MKRITLLMHRVSQCLMGVAFTLMVSLSAAHAQTPSINALEQQIKQACPNNWEDVYAEIAFQTGEAVWPLNLTDRADFVKYANDYLKDASGSIAASSFHDAVAIIYQCGGNRFEYLQQVHDQATAFLTHVTANQNLDSDNDGINDGIDLCPDTNTTDAVNTQGCSVIQLDNDQDGVNNVIDACPNTELGAVVNAEGCALILLDTDNDGVNDLVDQCANTASTETPDATGCAPSQIDSDDDGTPDYLDAYPLQHNSLCTP